MKVYYSNGPRNPNSIEEELSVQILHTKMIAKVRGCPYFGHPLTFASCCCKFFLDRESENTQNKNPWKTLEKMCSS
jgi:hypothetical protein